VIVLDEMRRKARLLVGPVLGIAATGYFVYHAFEGERGLRAGREITQQLFEARQALAIVESERDALQHRVAGLEPEHVDRDLLDQQIRSTLDLVGPNEIVILNPSNKP